jgi:dTDP-glucose 4,6-dehydratase
MNTVLITGGCGAIGSEVLNAFKRMFPDTFFVNLDALTYAGKEAHVEAPYDKYAFVYGDICDAKLVSYILDKYKPNVVMHFAAETHVDNSFGNSFKFTSTNILGTHTLLECVRKYVEDDKDNSFDLFLHMSTDEVYGSVKEDEPARTEDSLMKPSNPYSATKAGAEMLCHAYAKSFKLPIIIVRCNNAISKYQHPEKLIPNAIRCITNNQKVPVHGQGYSKRTFVHTDDIASAMAIIIDRGSIGSIYNIGTENECDVKHVISVILQKLKPGENVEDWVEYVPDRAFQDYRYSIDTTALRELGWSERVTFEEAIESLVRAS